MSNIVTFYSYKGGVGRSMALANIAVLLAKRGLRVLVVDWDLEAPGLERYFSYFKTEPFGRGLLDLLIRKEPTSKKNIEKNVWRITGDIEDQSFCLSFLPSGKEGDSDYLEKLERFDWKKYFARGGGDYIESLRENWRNTYDVTLIDSRTGLSDAGGVCTIQLPDIVVAMFTANYQSLYGVRDVMRLAQVARNELAYDRMHLAVLPLPGRFESRTEFRESQDWLRRFAEVLEEFYKDWLPTWLEPNRVAEILKIPQVDFFGFGEKLAVVEQGTSNPDGMGFIFNRVATLLSNNLRDVETVLKIEPTSTEHRIELQRRRISQDYTYDVYISYAHQPVLNEWLRALVEELRQWVSVETGEESEFFFDYRELSLGDSWAEQTSTSLLRAKLLLPILTPAFFKSKWCMREWNTFQDREQSHRKSSLILPIKIRGDDNMLPSWTTSRKYFDMSDLPLHVSAFSDKRQAMTITERIQVLAKDVVRLLREVPTFDAEWAVSQKSDWPSLPSTLSRNESGKHDDLTAIGGIGPALAKKLNSAGISSYAQLAALTNDDIERLEKNIIKFSGRIKRDDWTGQAKELAKRKG